MSPWVSLYTASSLVRVAGAFTSTDAGSGSDVEGGLTPNTVGQLTTGTLTDTDTGAVVEGPVVRETVVEVGDVFREDRAT
jgi:hypothetical protein